MMVTNFGSWVVDDDDTVLLATIDDEAVGIVIEADEAGTADNELETTLERVDAEAAKLELEATLELKTWLELLAGALVYRLSLEGPPHNWSFLPAQSIPQSLATVELVSVLKTKESVIPTTGCTFLNSHVACPVIDIIQDTLTDVVGPACRVSECTNDGQVLGRDGDGGALGGINIETIASTTLG